MSNTSQTNNTIKAQYKGHEFLLTAGGSFIKDLTQEALDRDLGGVKERAVREGRRLFMIDNRKNAAWYKYGLDGVLYRDLTTGRDYILMYFPSSIVLLMDAETLYLYDVIAQKDGRKYLDGWIFNVKEPVSLRSFIENFNWQIKTAPRNKNLLMIRETCQDYVHGKTSVEESGSDFDKRVWKNLLTINLRDEFRDADPFPLVIANYPAPLYTEEIHVPSSVPSADTIEIPSVEPVIKQASKSTSYIQSSAKKTDVPAAEPAAEPTAGQASKSTILTNSKKIVCPNCKNEINADQLFCDFCGEPIRVYRSKNTSGEDFLNIGKNGQQDNSESDYQTVKDENSKLTKENYSLRMDKLNLEKQKNNLKIALCVVSAVALLALLL